MTYQGISTAEIGQDRPSDRGGAVIVLDTDPGVRWALEKGLKRSGYDVRTASTSGEALRILYAEPVRAVIMEILPEADLTPDVLTTVLESPPKPKVICVSMESDPKAIIECVRRGAADFVTKPFNLNDVRAVLRRALASQLEQRSLRRPGSSRAGMETSYLIGVSHALQELRTIIHQVAHTDLNCLIRGESGTGKDLVAREIHRLSARRDRPFIKVNCSALPEQLLESELFGYEKGAFTGALSSKPGRFELANNGIIFLDEIGDMYPNLQAKILQVIEHKEFTKLGGRKHIHVDVQILAATNADLESKTKEGSFRHDLYFRLNEVCIWVPPLSARKEDIPLLVRHFVQKHGGYGVGEAVDISGDELARLIDQPWPGNVRELESTVKRWIALGDSAITFSKRSPAQESPTENGKAQPSAGAAPPPIPVQAQRSESERILDALEKHKWNRRKASEELGMSYQTLRRRIEKHQLDKRR
jgi:two-component system response regulator AtoC